jgi:hypothetical protein
VASHLLNIGDGDAENREVVICSVFTLFAEGKKGVTESWDTSRFVVLLFDDMMCSKHTGFVRLLNKKREGGKENQC